MNKTDAIKYGVKKLEAIGYNNTFSEKEMKNFIHSTIINHEYSIAEIDDMVNDIHNLKITNLI